MNKERKKKIFFKFIVFENEFIFYYNNIRKFILMVEINKL